MKKINLTLFIALLICSVNYSWADTATFTYDELNRLTSATYGTSQIEYHYDSAGNIIQVATPSGCDTVYYRDADGDGFGDPNNFLTLCSQATGYISDNTDCNDSEDLEHPGQTWYLDTDGDGYPESLETVASCERPPGRFAADELVSITVADNSPQNPNPDQNDSDSDGVGDASDPFPNNANYKMDTDGDGLADEWETAMFGNLTVADATSDSDGDGLADIQEFSINSDPNESVCNQWDANGDGRIGVEEAIRALQITSGEE